MNHELASGHRSATPTNSGRSSPVPRIEQRRAVEDALFRADKGLRRYGLLVEKAVGSWEVSPQEWADYIAFLNRLLKAIQSHPKDVPTLPHSDAVASKLAQCLSPVLPSGVHQKALEVYEYIFQTFGNGYVASHLTDYLPGLAPVLSFASLTVRPGVYHLFETYLVQVPLAAIRPALKSIVLGLLPALEDETSEDFDRAGTIMTLIRTKFEQEAGPDAAGFFWQTMFLCVMTSPSRRLGALNYLARHLPRLTTPSEHETGMPSSQHVTSGGEISENLQAIVSPDPGLLIRCFAAGLMDSQMLVYRGFLDLLATHLPLHSPVISAKVESSDLDILITAALAILLRRDTSLNRRVWSWLLGPDFKEPSRDGESPAMPQSIPDNEPSGNHITYFWERAHESMRRCVLAMLLSGSQLPAVRSRPYRICLSLMDHWEIGGVLAPEILLPALKVVHEYSLVASQVAVSEVLRSASQFFDAVEAATIWSTFVDLLRNAFQGSGDVEEAMSMLSWTLKHFNVQDQEMTTVHAPLTLLYMLTLLTDRADQSSGPITAALKVVAQLVELIPEDIFPHTRQNCAPDTTTAAALDSIDVDATISLFYKDARGKVGKSTLPIDLSLLALHLTVEFVEMAILCLSSGHMEAFQHSTELLIDVRRKCRNICPPNLDELYNAIETLLMNETAKTKLLPLPLLSTAVNVLANNVASPASIPARFYRWTHPLVSHLWRNLSPSSPKYHVEAVKAIWRLGSVAESADIFEASLVQVVQPVHGNIVAKASEKISNVEIVSRFMILWIHTLPSSSSAVGATPGRRRSTHASTLDDTQYAQRLEVLSQPLFRLLDLLPHRTDRGCDLIVSWLGSLPNLESVFDLLLARYGPLLQSCHEHDDAETNVSLKRKHREDVRELTHVCDLLETIFTHATDWTWQCLAGMEVTIDAVASGTGLSVLVHSFLRLLDHASLSMGDLHRQSLNLIDIVFNKSGVADILHMEFTHALLDRMLVCLSAEEDDLQRPLLRLTSIILRRQARNEQILMHDDKPRQSSMYTRQPQALHSEADSMPNSAADNAALIAKLLGCLQTAFTARPARPHLEQWLAFLNEVLPVFAGAIFTSLIPLVETLCDEAQKVFDQLVTTTMVSTEEIPTQPEATLIYLLDALESTLARAHERLDAEANGDEVSKISHQTSNLLSTVSSGVFRTSGIPSKTAQSNSRLTVILALQDTIRVCFSIWIWSNRFSAVDGYDKSSAATSTYCALRLRSKARSLLEELFAAEPLESLEVLLSEWINEDIKELKLEASAIELLQAMHGSRPKHIIPALLDALCSRIIETPLPSPRQSTLTIELHPNDVALCLHIYVQSIEDDAVDEIWSDCISFLRDVLSNATPYRLIMPTLLSLAHLLAQKARNTNFGEQRKLRRDLAEIFQKLMTATFSMLPSGSALPSQPVESWPAGGIGMTLPAVFQRIVADLDALVDNTDRATIIVNSVCSNLLTPDIHARTFPSTVDADHLDLLHIIARTQPLTKVWKKDVADAFNDPRLFATPAMLMREHWMPVLQQWAMRDRDRMSELLARLTAPSSAGIMFGVGANAARLDADRKAQLNIRRICLLLLSSPPDTWAAHVHDFDEKIIELSASTNSSSPTANIKTDLYLLCRVLTLSLSPVHILPLWPTINTYLQAGLVAAAPSRHSAQTISNLGLLQACKLLDQLVALSPDEFQLHEWLYITDTVDAVYQPAEHAPTALAEQIVEALGPESLDASNAALPPPLRTTDAAAMPLLIGNGMVDTEDVKAMSRDDFAKAIVRPFLGQLSMQAYESMYRSEQPSVDFCVQALLEDLLDTSSMVD
ncbi:hypothetical protein LTR62_002570 [Meristemomyces frigidus]|uniref:Dopey N-terminal domain-containing protein n=1 Tax=Meristemomyces frigidus TaxID=1508187 RepID=A0AAN7YS44_9PEZI|nr:hypothetical protein LTR62_002570 [Meristemomyces frigidus]